MGDSEDGPPDGPPEIVFFGDSLTYGMAHDRAGRYDVPWPRLVKPFLTKLYENELQELKDKENAKDAIDSLALKKRKINHNNNNNNNNNNSSDDSSSSTTAAEDDDNN